ncbi:T9SS type A sorting domain-containing protein, partial [candidate division KSB1 bacterium]|nr:T9SS type A sorting domain-containing protein [candidate division KSB1 bacterium]
PTPSLAFSSAGMLYGLKGAGTQPNKLISIDTNTGTGTVLGSTGVTGLRTIAMSPGTTAVEGRAPEGLPQSYALAQNYPNPFNAQTVIEYQLPQAGHVKLVVYNLLGQEIKTLINKNHEAGQYNLVWNGKDNLGQAVPSGVYFYRIQAEGFTETKKMLLLE